MDRPVNLENLHEITGGDPVMEARLFRLFLESSSGYLVSLRTAAEKNDAATWQKEAHAFKGMCLNLGAEPLAAICQRAETTYSTQNEDNGNVIAAMEKELARVRAVIGA